MTPADPDSLPLSLCWAARDLCASFNSLRLQLHVIVGHLNKDLQMLYMCVMWYAAGMSRDFSLGLGGFRR